MIPIELKKRYPHSRVEDITDAFMRGYQACADAEPMTEEAREALMRLTMCAREECGMCKYKDKCGFEFQYNISTENMNTILEALSADAVQGEWIWRTDIPIGDGRTSAGYICSHCGKDYWHGNKLKFCPNCGARMKGGAE